jgi:predicted RNase H-like nuclease (RuvC/YqgF family)
MRSNGYYQLQIQQQILTPLFAKLESLRPPTPVIVQAPPPPPPPPPAPPSAHKLDEEKEVVENILTNTKQVLAHLFTLTDSITNLTTHLNNTTSRLQTEESHLQTLISRKTALEAELVRLEATIHLRNLELAQFTQKAEHLESRILRAKTAVQLSGSKVV